MKKPKIISGGYVKDKRGLVYFNNNFKFINIKRFYIVQNYKKDFIRAWHGHLKEEKYIFCVQGKAKIGAVKISNIKNPSKKKNHYFSNWILVNQILSLFLRDTLMLQNLSIKK